ncbi:endonuclease/exonuclease/phosphatase family protein [Neorhizobium galegae]|uniref:endonuclease/exonuclease/phosphatase family protein n=1 Tax=Neorhizobium galegae TaxID=399 RepID=UPI0006229893|nr:endonuclease/exonuclease/phosphatase family protein [Neorhizobium galegae]KAB1114786.1 endonuclease/exonuclease/phosphatase family protein [Neorhizobium galegae]MCQ1780006.1 endonuclease/exonuclease/phosphatase family protein [Neorhizobium galegae]MCQ1794108.1 endonuclease/exonuclease/phosphatase family protein [Neorhizobium galegae]CDZ25858.1 Endonuclease/exonuclease/phosphatase family protein [Neorhizobium galegae bv. officinalis]
MTDQTSPAEAGPSPAQSLKTRHRLKILSYNVHSCIGTDRRLDPARVAEVIAALEPDIIGLQELDVGRSRTGGIDQAHTIASLLQMEFHFHAALNVAEERYGDAILTALPARMIKGAGLPSHGEQRGAVWVEIDVGEHKLQVFNTHLGLLGGDRMRQIGEILGTSWMGSPECQGKPKILIGDFNAIPITKTYKTVAGQMADAPLLSGTKPRATFPSRFPLLRIDHVFVSSEVTPIASQVVSTPLSRRASDHLPLLVTVEL